MRATMTSIKWATLVLTLLVPTDVMAAFITIDDFSQEGVVTIFAGDFEGDFFANNVQLSSGIGSGGSLTVDESDPVNFAGRWFDNGATAFTSRTIYWVEGHVPTVISDILEYQAFSHDDFGFISGSFRSDATGAGLGLLPSGVDPKDVVIETGPTAAFDFSQPFLSARAISDGEVVPEPATLLLLGSGLAGVGGLAWRRYRRQK